MATEIIGLTDSTKILNSAVFTKSDIGFATLVETYTVTPLGVGILDLSPLSPHPIFPTLVVESASTTDKNGGLKEVVIRYIGAIKAESEKYIGLPSSQVPEQPSTLDESELAKITITTTQAGQKQLLPSQENDPELVNGDVFDSLIATGKSKGQWVVFPYIVSIQFLDMATEENEMTFYNSFQPGITTMPSDFRGVELPKPARGPFIETGNSGRGVSYFGVRCLNTSIQRQGIFNVCRVSFADSFYSWNI